MTEWRPSPASGLSIDDLLVGACAVDLFESWIDIWLNEPFVILCGGDG